MKANPTPPKLLKTYSVNYIFGLPGIPGVIRKISMHFYDNGFLFRGENFRELWIPHNIIIDFKISSGWGSAIGYGGVANALSEKIINIDYVTVNGDRFFLKFEMAVSIHHIKNDNVCKELFGLMYQHKIFNKFLRPYSAGKPQSDTPTLIQKLSSLHKQGILTDDEFKTKKAELLKRL